MENILLSVKNLSTSFKTSKGMAAAVRNVSFDLHKNEILGIVGESGSGKSVTMKSVMGLLPGTAKIEADEILYKDIDLSKLNEKELQKYRGNEMAMIFQDPLSALNPVRKIGYHMVEVIRRYNDCSKAEAQKIAIQMLDQVGIPEPERRLNQYPHEFSGGMRQRVLIAMALSLSPSLLVADEPTTALDVTVQAQILRLLKKLRDEDDMSIVLISHDMGVMADMCDRILVMYCGTIVEEGTVDEIFYEPKHPYTQALLKSIPRPEAGKDEKLLGIEGAPPSLLDIPKGCPFASRCASVTEECKLAVPEETFYSPTHKMKCIRKN